MSTRDFTNIAVGDTVIVRHNNRRTLHKVTKVTRTQFTIETGVRFMRSDGIEYGGDGWRLKNAAIPRADEIASVKAQQRQELAISDARSLQRKIDDVLNRIAFRHEEGWGPSIETSNFHLGRALEALQTKQLHTTP